MKTHPPLWSVAFWLVSLLVLASCRPSAAIPPTAEPSPTPLPTATPSPDITQALGRIAFITPDGQLHTIRPDGTDERPLTRDTAFYQFPAWSPTSNHIAVIGSGRTAERGLFVLADEPDSAAIPLYTQTSPIYLYWSPNGQQVSFIANAPRGLALHLAPADGTAESAILTTGQPLYWQWLPSNERALTHASSGALAFVDVAGNVEELAWGAEGQFQAPALSADGRYMAYSDEGDAGRTLFVHDLEQEASLFQHPHRGVVTMSWSPTAAQLAFISPAPNRTAPFGPLQLYDVATADGRLLLNERVLGFFWSPNGQWLAAVTLAGQNNQQAKGGTAAKAAVLPTQSDELRLSLMLIEVGGTGAVRPLTQFRPTRLFLNQFLPFFDQYALSHRLWSPDSQYIVLPVLGEEGSELVVVPIDGRPPLPLTPGLSAFWSHQ